MPDSSITLSCAKIGSLKDSEMDEMSTDFGFPIDSDRDVFDSGDESLEMNVELAFGTDWTRMGLSSTFGTDWTMTGRSSTFGTSSFSDSEEEDDDDEDEDDVFFFSTTGAGAGLTASTGFTGSALTVANRLMSIPCDLAPPDEAFPPLEVVFIDPVVVRFGVSGSGWRVTRTGDEARIFGMSNRAPPSGHLHPAVTDTSTSFDTVTMLTRASTSIAMAVLISGASKHISGPILVRFLNC